MYYAVISGSKIARRRSSIKRLLDYSEDGDTVVVWRIDHLGPSLLDMLATVNLLRDGGVKVRSISDNIDPDTSSRRMMLGMLATLAEHERELITERVNAGIAAAKQNGTQFGRPPVVEVTEKLAITEDSRAKGRTAQGRSPSRRLDTSNLVPTPRQANCDHEALIEPE